MASETPATFELFPNLPLELRRKIWLHSLPPSHTFQLNIEDTAAIESRPGIKSRFPEQSLLNDPTALRTSRESRAVALEHYVRKPGCFSPFYLFVDYAVDVFVMWITETGDAGGIAMDPTGVQNVMVYPNGMHLFDEALLGLVICWFRRWFIEFPSLKCVVFDASAVTGTVDTAAAEAVVAKVYAAVETLGEREREAGRSWKGVDVMVKIQKNDGFRFESRLRIEETPDHPLG